MPINTRGVAKPLEYSHHRNIMTYGTFERAWKWRTLTIVRGVFSVNVSLEISKHFGFRQH